MNRLTTRQIYVIAIVCAVGSLLLLIAAFITAR